MAIRKADGTRVTKAQLEALMTTVSTVVTKAPTEHIYRDYNTPSSGGTSFESQRQLLFHAGENITQADIDALFPAATFVSITPATGPAAGGTDVVIKGTNFSGVSGVTIGGVATTDFEVVDSQTIHCTTGAHAAGAVATVIADDNANVTANASYTYV